MKNSDKCKVAANVTRRDFVKVSSMVAALPLVGSNSVMQPVNLPLLLLGYLFRR